MKRITVALSGVAVAGIAVAAGFVSGARWANLENRQMSYELGAYDAGQSARYLAAVRGGTVQLTTQFFEDRIDNAFANLTYAREELSPGARAELKLAADYRRQFPNPRGPAGWDDRVKQGMLQAR